MSKNPRNQEICKRYKDGESYIELAISYDMAASLIRKILVSNGLAQFTQIVPKEPLSFIELNKVCLDKYGITIKEKIRLAKEYKIENSSPTTLYFYHKRDLLKADYAYTLTFPQWWAIWLASGQWKNYRAIRTRYLMALKPDCTEFNVDSVHIIPCPTGF